MGAQTEISKDVFGRPMEKVLRDDSGTVELYETAAYSATVNGGQALFTSTFTSRQGFDGTETIERVSETDLLDRLVRAGTNNHFTYLDYTTDNGLSKTTIKPHGQYQREFWKDWLGRTRAENHPELDGEGSADINNNYDYLGRLEFQTTPSHHYQWDYDGLGRVTTKWGTVGLPGHRTGSI